MFKEIGNVTVELFMTVFVSTDTNDYARGECQSFIRKWFLYITRIAYPVHIAVVGQIDIASWVRELSLAGKHKAEVMPSLKVYSR